MVCSYQLMLKAVALTDPERVSIFVDRKDTGLIVPYRWDKSTHPKHLQMFKSLLTYWKLFKNYDPSNA